MTAWPFSIPDMPLAGSLAVAERENLTLGPSDIPGLESRRQRYSGMAADYAFSLILTTSELDALWAFYKTDCKGGALSFTKNDHSLATLASHSFVWAAPPAAQSMTAPGYWSVQVSLVRLP